MFTCRHSLESLLSFNLLLLTLASSNSILGLQFSKEAELPNGLLPPLNLGARETTPGTSLIVNSRLEIIES